VQDAGCRIEDAGCRVQGAGGRLLNARDSCLVLGLQRLSVGGKRPRV
jgi:hypothetical protein